MLQKLQVTIIILFIPAAIIYYVSQQSGGSINAVLFPGDPVVHVGDIPLRVDIADTPASRTQGLSGRNDLINVDGMLFIFDEPDYHGIWMKDMKFAIDIIWINKDGIVVAISEQVSPNTYPRVFEPPVPVLYLIETNALFTESFGIKVGDQVRIPPKLLR